MAEQQKQVPLISPDGKTTYLAMDDVRKLINYESLQKIKLRNLEKTTDTNPTYRKYPKDRIVSFLGNPAASEAQLRDMSIYLFNVSNYYRRLIQYFAGMSTYSYIVVPYGENLSKSVNKAMFEKSYFTAVSYLEKLNIAHEFTKALTIAFRDDVFYGYVWETNDSFTIQPLDPNRCKISSIEDGVYNFAFDFSYFDSNIEKLPNYPVEFATMYQLYRDVGAAAKWQELDSGKSICLKVNEQDIVPIPPFVSLFSALADIEDYRAITKNASEIDNYKALALEIPVGDDGALLIDYELCTEFYNMLCNILPENIGAFMTPMKVSSWNFEKSGTSSEINNVANAEAAMWSQAGVNKILFGGGEDPSASTLSLCTVNDQMIVFAMMRQIERWINRRLKKITKKYKFKISILDVTVYNRAEMHAQFLKDGQYGLPVRTAIMAVQGYSPSDTRNMAYLENEILKLSQHEVPLTSSNTQSAEEVGRPANADSGRGLSDAGNVSADRQGG